MSLYVTLCILLIALSQLGQSWKALCWMLPPKPAVSQRTTSRDLKLFWGMNRWTKLYKRNVQDLKFTAPWRWDARRRIPKRQRLPTLMTSAWQSMPSGWQVWGKERKSQQYLQMSMMFSVSPNRWIAQTRTSLVILCTQWCCWAKADPNPMKAWVKQGMYCKAQSRMRIDDENSERFDVGVAHRLCHMCNGKAWCISGRPVTQVDIDGSTLDVEGTFCFIEGGR